MSVIDRFPAGYEPRDIQKEIIAEIDECIKSGYRRIILCSPTGVGKSLVGITLCRHFGSSFTVTATKHLQDQYSGDFEFLMPIKGMSNYPCLKTMDQNKVTDERAAMSESMTCDRGVCEEKKIVDGQEITENCKYKPVIQDIEERKQNGVMCHYYTKKYTALVSAHALCNYHSYFQMLKYNRKSFERYLDRRVAIFDEAHKIEDQIIQFVGTDIFAGQIQECGLDVKHYRTNDIDSMTGMLDDMADYYSGQIRDLGDMPGRIDYDAITRLERRYKWAADARAVIVSDTDNFVINKPLTDDNNMFKSVSIKPVSITKFCKSYFETEYQLFMSATIDKKSFCENTGFDADSTAIVDTPRSPFPVQNRGINFLNVAWLSARATPQDELAVIKKIDELMNDHADHRGIILTSSISRCYSILDGLSDRNKSRIRICHSKNSNGKTQDEILREHAGTPGSVLLSSSLWEGVDLKDDLSRFQIIAKVPYPNFTEKRVAKKKELFPTWYTSQTLTKLLQGFGRSIRSEDDWARTYVLDSAVGGLLRNAKGLVPRSFHDVIKLP